jgi:hypothetical protein
MKKLIIAITLLFSSSAHADNCSGLASCHDAGDLSIDENGYVDSRSGARSGRGVYIVRFTDRVAFTLSSGGNLFSTMEQRSTGRVNLYVGRPTLTGGDLVAPISAITDGASYSFPGLPASYAPYVIMVEGYTSGTYGVWGYTQKLEIK